MVREEKYKESAERIRSAAKAKDFNQSSLARELGVSRSTVNAWWRGQYRPEGENLEQLATALGQEAAYLVGFEREASFNPAQLIQALTSAKRARDELDDAIKALESARQAPGKVVELPTRGAADWKTAATGGNKEGAEQVEESSTAWREEKENGDTGGDG